MTTPQDPTPGLDGRPDFAAPPPSITDASPAPPPDATTPQPLAPLSPRVSEERLHPLSPLVRGWVFVLAGGYALFSTIIQGQIRWEDVTRIGSLVEQMSGWSLALIAALLLSLGFGYWGWWTTKIVIDDNELRLENTGAFQESKRIAFSRIQSVDINQRLAARLLGLAEVTIDVGADAPTTLSVLTRTRATQMRDYLMARAHRQQVATSDTVRIASAWDDSAQGDQVLIRLHPGEIILGAVLSSELPFLLLAFLVPLGFSIWLQQPWIALGAGVLPLIIAMGGFLSKRLVGQFNYTLATTPAGIRLTRGLTTLHSQTIPAHRVQSVQISQPLLWRPLKRARLTLTVLGLKLGDDSQDLSTVYLPIGNPRQIQLALTALWPNLRLEDLRFHRTPRRARWLSPLSWSWLGYAGDDQVLAVRDGWFERHQTIIPHARLQSMQISQGPLERRLRLVTVVALTGGTLTHTRIKHLEADQARGLAFGEMDLAREARSQERQAPPPTGATWHLTSPTAAESTDEAHLWTPSTSIVDPQPPSLPYQAPASPADR